jgi:hypothetical protein
VKELKDIIKITAERTGHNENLVENVLRSMFEDVQSFTSRKRGYCIQVPQVGTFVFRAAAIPKYIDNQKGTLVHWISRLLIGEEKNLPKTVWAAKANIAKCFYCLKRTTLIKHEFIEKHATYKPKRKQFLQDDISSDTKSVDEYIALIKAQLFENKNHSFSPEDLRDMQASE